MYGSFYPWSFHWRPLPASPLWILLHSWPATLDPHDARDAIVNVTLYIPFGVFSFLSLTGSRGTPGGSAVRPRLLSAALATTLGALLSACIEMLQLFEPERVCSLLDLFCNTLGTLGGTALAATFPAAISGAVTEAESIGVFDVSSVMALLYLWAGYQLFPFFPNFSPYLVLQKLHVLAAAGWVSWRDAFESFAGWMAASALLDRLCGRRAGGPIAALATLAVPFKLLIADRTATAPEMAGAVFAVLLWLVLRYRGWSRLLAAMLVLLAIAAAGLEPFHFAGPFYATGAARPFSWVPFLALLRTPWEPAFVILFRKSFLYGASIWMLQETLRRPQRNGWAPSALVVAAMLGIVEAAQVYLPGHVAEITDPVLALLMGFGLMLLDRPSTAQRRQAGARQLRA